MAVRTRALPHPFAPPRRRGWRRTLATLTAAALGAAGSVVVGATPAAAVGTVAVPTGPVAGSVGHWRPVDGVSISGFTAKLRVDVTASAGLVRYTATGTGAADVPGFANTTNGLAQIAMTGTEAQINAALATLQHRGSSVGAATITIDAADPPALYSPDTQHYYRVFGNTSGVAVSDARAAALASTLSVGGQTHSGYLANVTSSAENAFLAQRAFTYGWIGATDSAVEGQWRWMDGPEAGQLFCTGNNPCNSSGGAYVAWAGSEPNDSGGEDYAVINWTAPGDGTWNDLPGSYNAVRQYVVEYGVGSLPAANVAQGVVTMDVTAPTAPGVPTAVTPVRGNGQASVSFTAPAGDGGAAITSYRVTASPGGAFCTATPPATGCTVTGLANGTAYTFTATATNAVGSSAASAASSPVTPATVPSTPAAPSATRGDGQAVVTWTAPAANGSAISSTTATASPGGASCTDPAPATTCTITGLTNGTSYTVTIAATNDVGTSGTSPASSAVVPAAVPDAPTDVSATPGNGQATVTWTAPAANGSPITGYTVTASPDGATCSTVNPTVSCTVTGLDNGTPTTFTVVATNGVGPSAASAASTAVTPATLPSTPAPPAVQRTDAGIFVAWVLPAANGSAIVSTTATASPGGASCTVPAPATTCTLTGLPNGTTHTVRVTAANGLGDGPTSAASAAVTPAAVPSTPTDVVVVGGNGEATVTWSPSADNGAAIVEYTVTAQPGDLTCTALPPATTCTITGLANGTPYTFAVTATNDVGQGPADGPAEPVTPATVPGIPGNVRTAAGDHSVTVVWDPPSDGGSPILTYTATASPGGASCTVAAPETRCTITGLANGSAYSVTVTATNAVGGGTAAPPAAETPAPGFTPLPQERLVDTREGGGGTPAAGSVVTVPLAGAQLPSGTMAVLVNLTGVDAATDGYVTIYPCGTPPPLASSLNVTPGQAVANLAIVRVPVGTTALCAFTSTHAEIVIDLVGAFGGDVPESPDGGLSFARAPFETAPPTRLVDTRVGGTGPLDPGAVLRVDARDLPGVSELASAAVVTLTTDGAARQGYVTAYACEDGRPSTSTLNLDPLGATANVAVVPLTGDRQLCVFSEAGTHVIVDLVGSFTPTSESVLTATDHRRVLDTRDGTGGVARRLAPQEVVRLDLGAIVPIDATVAALNVTATDADEVGYVTVWACGTPRPATSNLNPKPGRQVPDVVLVPLGTGAHAGTVCLYTDRAAHLVVDLQGWFAPLSG